MTDTEIHLKIWRGDQIVAERLSATILHIDGFSSVDPQCPLGGPDGLKDILCEKNGWRYVAACYFPISDKKFTEVRDKFVSDLEGVKKNSASGIVFLTNQALTPGERDALLDIAIANESRCILYHLERVRALLDSPAGYGARLEFLKVGMSMEDQISFFSKFNHSFENQLKANSLMIIRELSKKIDSLEGKTDSFNAHVAEIGEVVLHTQSMLSNMTVPSDKANISISIHKFSTKEFTVNDLCLLHSALFFDAPKDIMTGTLRTNKIWIGETDGDQSKATFIPPGPELVPELLEDFLKEWRNSFDQISKSSIQIKLSSIAKFHHQLLHIHPFMDGNGRIARFLLTQQSRELLNQNQRIILEDKRPYFDALFQADHGNYAALTAHITQAIFGVESIEGWSDRIIEQ